MDRLGRSAPSCGCAGKCTERPKAGRQKRRSLEEVASKPGRPFIRAQPGRYRSCDQDPDQYEPAAIGLAHRLLTISVSGHAVRI